ncbi:MAG TPA: sulfatase-like hydrolase/transferase, partial [Polyangiaceae bacterium]|nr:sulfatase-like hydrolase/transferase [Polyangiaceae bacterium]
MPGDRFRERLSAGVTRAAARVRPVAASAATHAKPAALALGRALARPPAIGAAYVAALALWAVRAPPGDAQQLGADAQAIEAFVTGRFGGEIAHMLVGVLAAAIAYGIVLGFAAQGLVMLRDWLHPAYPMRLKPWLRVFLGVVGLHGLIELRAMASDPPLYAEAWYARGGWRRTVQVLASDVLHPGGVVFLGVLLVGLWLAGPRRQWWRWPDRVRRASRRLRERAARALAVASASLAMVLLAFVVGRLPAAHARVDAGDPRPNVLILAADSLRADHLERRVAPNFAALADRGTRFEKTYVSLPRTFPSWVTWLTGRHPHHHGIRSMFPRWEERAKDFDALPERLARAGWSTGVVSDYAGDVFSRIDLGFGTVNVPQFDFRQLVRQHVMERETPLLPVLHSRLGRSAFPVLREMNDAADPQMLARDAVSTMRSLEGRGPFFLLVFFSTAHFPYAAPSPFYARYTDASYRGRYKYDKPVGLGQDAPPDDRDEAQVRGLYDGAVASIDTAAQRILDALEADGLTKSTILVVTGDHGETLYEHGHGQGHGDHLFGDEGTHVPLVIVDPRLGSAPEGDAADAAHKQPRRVPAVTRDVDLAPTIYALTGV